HDPSEGQMRRRGGEIGDEQRALATGLDENTLMMRGVSWRRQRANAGNDFALGRNEGAQPRLGDRHEIVWEVASGGTLVGVRGVVVFAFLHDIARVRERR